MEFSELQKIDIFGAFEGFVSMQQAKAEGLLMTELHSSFSDRCACGSEIIISKNLTRYTCCDPRCYFKMGDALHHVFKDFGCKNVGEVICNDMAKYALPTLGFKSHLALLVEGPDYEVPGIYGVAMNNFRMAAYQVRTSELSFPDMVTRIGIPSIGPGSRDIFRGISGIKELLEKITHFGDVRRFLFSRGVEDLMKCFYLHHYLEDIFYAEFTVFTTKVPVGKIDMPICITGEIHYNGYRVKKREFVDFCNKRGQLSPNFRLFNIHMNEAVNSNDHIIADGPSSNAKYITALERQQWYDQEGFNKKILYTPNEFVDLLDQYIRVYTAGMQKKAEQAEGEV